MKNSISTEDENVFLTLLDLFDSNWYLKQYPGIAKKNIDPLKHYLKFGGREGRKPNPLFDSSWYLEEYSKSGEIEINPLLHYIIYGVNKGYNPNPLFHTNWYLTQYPEVASNNINPLAHYLQMGIKEGLNPNPLFDTAWYLEQNPDIAAKGFHPLDHYLLHGGFEKRDPCPKFNTKYFLAKHPSIAASKIHPLVYYFAHQHDGDLNPESYSLPSFIEEQLLEASKIEPLLKLSLDKLNSMRILYQPVKLASLDALEIIEDRVDFDIDHLILLPNLDSIDISLVSDTLQKILSKVEEKSSVLILATDENSPQELDFLPSEICSMSLTSLVPEISPDQREKVILFIIQNYRPKHVWNLNSMAAWRLFDKSGKPLSTLTKLNAYLFLSQDQSDQVTTVKEIDYYRKNLLHLSETYVANKQSKAFLEKICGLSNRLAESIYILD